jgi:hypothetical protein
MPIFSGSHRKFIIAAIIFFANIIDMRNLALRADREKLDRNISDKFALKWEPESVHLNSLLSLTRRFARLPFRSEWDWTCLLNFVGI